MAAHPVRAKHGCCPNSFAEADTPEVLSQFDDCFKQRKTRPHLSRYVEGRLSDRWSEDRDRCRAADIPKFIVYHPKADVALELYDRAYGNGVPFARLTFDEGCGKSVAFLNATRSRGQHFVAEVPVSCTGWIAKLRTTTHRRPSSLFARTPRLVEDSRPFRPVRSMLGLEPKLTRQPLTEWRMKDGDKGPMVWEAKCVWFNPRGVDDLPQDGHY